MKIVNEIEPTVQPLPQGNDDLSKALRLETILKNRFLGVNVEDGITNIGSIEKLLEDLDKGSNVVTKLEDKYINLNDDSTAEKLSDLNANLTAMWNCLHDLREVFEEKKELRNRLKL